MEYMKDSFIKFFLVFVLTLLAAALFAQQTQASQKFALVIGNGNYSGLSKLANPVNDAEDVAAALQKLGFTVDKLLNGSLEQMESAVTRLRNRLSAAEDSYGFFFYAGHGVQSGGENYLIPVDSNIPSETYLRNRAVSVQVVLDDLNEARNTLNVIVLDACRDNPFGWGRSGTRGLSVVNRQPADSIIVYATGAGQQASDGEGRNGLFTSKLLPHLGTGSMEVGEVFKRTGADVAAASGRRQVPAIYNQFFGTAYLGTASAEAVTAAYVPGSTLKPEPLPETPSRTERQRKERASDASATAMAHFWSIGAGIGTSFADPLLMGTVSGTISPFKYSFLKLGIDIGFLSAASDTRLYSFYPFGHLAFFWPFSEKIGVYAGAGAGYLIANYSFGEDDLRVNTAAMDICAGINLFSMLDISYTFRTSFSNSTNKLSVGYTYRFK